MADENAMHDDGQPPLSPFVSELRNRLRRPEPIVMAWDTGFQGDCSTPQGEGEPVILDAVMAGVMDSYHAATEAIGDFSQRVSELASPELHPTPWGDMRADLPTDRFGPIAIGDRSIPATQADHSFVNTRQEFGTLSRTVTQPAPPAPAPANPNKNRKEKGRGAKRGAKNALDDHVADVLEQAQPTVTVIEEKRPNVVSSDAYKGTVSGAGCSGICEVLIMREDDQLTILEATLCDHHLRAVYNSSKQKDMTIFVPNAMVQMVPGMSLFFRRVQQVTCANDLTSLHQIQGLEVRVMELPPPRVVDWFRSAKAFLCGPWTVPYQKAESLHGALLSFVRRRTDRVEATCAVAAEDLKELDPSTKARAELGVEPRGRRIGLDSLTETAIRVLLGTPERDRKLTLRRLRIELRLEVELVQLLDEAFCRD